MHMIMSIWRKRKWEEGKNEVTCLRSHNESGEPPALTPTLTPVNVSVTLQ